MKDFFDYDIKYPDLTIQLVKFFNIRSGEQPKRTIQDFVNQFQAPEGELPLQPDIVGRICDRLCELRKMVCLRKGSVMCFKDVYYALPIVESDYAACPDFFMHHYNSFVYGFEYIYRHYKDRTMPIIVKKGDNQPMGSCFRIYDGIATARHCIEDGSPVAIKGYSKEQLSDSKVFVSSNPDIDLAFIQTGDTMIYNIGEPHVLDNVLVMGYPKVACFLDFCTGEKANVSAMAEIRQTPTFGAIIAEEPMYSLPQQPLLLITAKIRGGNSGGPVINEGGYVIGVATDIPQGQGLSDDYLSYGIAYPIQALNAMIKENNEIKIEFTDF